ncbi:NAD-dependent epimerase/dehydratase family protein [Streptomyces longispororuber]|uniref:NAD-dependent epimerase/dehydratase family protein n=1 Tax=Streptomyces longispororuber TaxID=68230 RepID=UPI00210EB5A5|nr:NAD-dependent epimerase/dehydratase family protein [Streptomyces longispororuber]MCQ4210407.1 NAD-dependent epimerase/dehydratase family protein [Streptomyces longispororuber]
MRILLLGGTWFLGKAVARDALATGHVVTVFNRGLSAPDVQGTQAVRGDRTRVDDLDRLARQGPWDLVVDTSASEMSPRQVLTSARALEPVARQYVYVSTVNAYTGWPKEPLTEESPVYGAPSDADRDYGDGMGVTVHYGMQKAGCERAIRETFGEQRITILRPGVILGPGEYVGRLPWWLNRCAKGGDILAPGSPEQPIQPIDVRDVARFAITAPTGAFNVAAPQDLCTMNDLLLSCLTATRGDGRLVYAADEVLTAHGVREWTELPLWRTSPGTWAVDTRHAQAAGLVCRPLAETVVDTWAWMQTGKGPVLHPRWDQHGITPAKEREILAVLG